MYDFFFFLVPAIIFYEEDKIRLKVFVILIIPIISFEFIMYWLSVRQGN